ncbi:hypothetical protein Clacol_007105 [Clathrus columnatus]|uniref:Thiamin pyrophosphokinase catalytic domain-containing protein n=1 Tax=Clathrus columnatus TaxID=1419009 RepID=A0AAV5AI94_9AGAM|nr:hypothetical protein Clacol_007105 [Clathrus columnatus]
MLPPTTLPFLLYPNSDDDNTARTGLIILNQPTSRMLLERLWKAYGGANRLYDTLANDKDRLKFIPELIKGDLDSLRDDVRAYYLEEVVLPKGVEIIRDPDQYTTDLQKCLASLSELEKESNQQVKKLEQPL